MPRKGWKPSAETRARWHASMARHIVPPEVRFANRVEFDPFGGCWLWAGTIIPSTGYGQIGIGSKSVAAHRLSYELHHGPIPQGLMVCHRCDVRACVNPAHLFLGSHADNMADMARKGRSGSLRGDAHVRRKLSSQDIPGVMARLASGESCASIAADFGLTDCAINAIRRGKSWTHVTGITPARRAKHEVTFFDSDQGADGANNSVREVAA